MILKIITEKAISKLLFKNHLSAEASSHCAQAQVTPWKPQVIVKHDQVIMHEASSHLASLWYIIASSLCSSSTVNYRGFIVGVVKPFSRYLQLMQRKHALTYHKDAFNSSYNLQRRKSYHPFYSHIIIYATSIINIYCVNSMTAFLFFSCQTYLS